MKILIIRFSSIGDIVLTTPVIRALKLQIGAEIHYAVKEQYENILKSNPYVDKVHPLRNDLSDLREELKKEEFDYVIDLHNNLRSRILLSRMHVKTFRFEKLNIQKWLMVNFKINRLPDEHIVDRYRKTVESLGVIDDQHGLDYFIPTDENIGPEVLPASHRNGYIAYAIGGQHATKKLPVERMIELCEKINGAVVLLGGKEDYANGERIRLSLQQHEQSGTSIIFNACGKFNLNQSASIVQHSQRVFSHDTGLMHIAAALKKDVIAIWGSTIPEFGMYPYRTTFANIENKGLACRPCSKIGFDKCPKGHFKCMMEVELEGDFLRANEKLPPG